MNNPYIPIKATVDRVVEESSTIKSFALTPVEPFPFLAGQFIELTVPGAGEAPFTPSSSPFVTESMVVTIMEVGNVTEDLHRMSGGEVVGIRGPYGVPYPLSDFEGREIVICGGGVGLAPLRSLLLALYHDIDRYGKVMVRYGAREPRDIIYKEQLGEWERDDKLDVRVTVDRGDDGWNGHVGLVTTILDGAVSDPREAVAVLCGPPIMMKFATFKFLDIGFLPKNIFLSLEKNMSCGIGKCGHCRLGQYYVCNDGPVFTYEQVKDFRQIWE